MILIPAIDLKNNKCVRLIRGKEEEQTIFNENPVKQAMFFEESGCERLHVVDLDGAFGKPNINKETILKIRQKTNIPIELGGGIKNKLWSQTTSNISLIISTLWTTGSSILPSLIGTTFVPYHENNV